MTKPTQDEFLKYVANHEMTILHDEGVYRHVTFGQPNTGNMRYNLTTLPGRLCYSGDMGTYVFARVNDMFAFFRRSDGRINERYWAEKIEAADRHGAIKEYSEQRFREVISQHLDDIEANAELRTAVADEVIYGCDEYDDAEAHRVVSEFVSPDPELIPSPSLHAPTSEWLAWLEAKSKMRRPIFTDSYELDFTEYTYRFIWCLRAIVWGIAKYDESRVDGKT